MKLRELTDEGIELFKEYLNKKKNGEDTVRAELDDESITEVFRNDVRINPEKSFDQKMEIGSYLDSKFSQNNIDRDEIIPETNVWSWLAWLWLDEITPEDKVYAHERYIAAPLNEHRTFYRHQVSLSYVVYSLHGEENSRLFLDRPPYEHGDPAEQLASRQNILSSKTIIEAAHALYWDDEKGSVKNGANDTDEPGSIRRFVNVLRQLRVTYDVYQMNTRGLLNLLPVEFDRWK
jgi:hypothetical protein